jgi:hypothetical protein
MKRRDFMIGTMGFGGALLSRLAMGQVRPCPPPLVGVEGGQSTQTTCVDIDANADWLLRSTGVGVFYRNNFTFRNLAETLPIQNNSDLHASSFNGVTDSPNRIVWDTVNKLSGNGCLRINQPASSVGNYAGYRIGWDGIGATTKNRNRQNFYVQFAFLADAVYRNTFFGGTPDDGGTFGGKIAIIQAPDASNDTGEVVIRRCSKPGGFLQAYRLDTQGRYRYFYMQHNNVGGSTRWTTYAYIDRGAPTVTNVNTLEQRHGPVLETDATGADPDYQHVPHFGANEWFVMEAYINLASQVVKIWLAPYGSAPELCLGGMGSYVNLPAPGSSDGSNSNPGKLYTGFQLTNYPNSPNNWNSTDTFICYDEVIASDNPIPFPGGRSLPYPGTAVPPNWPPANANGY